MDTRYGGSLASRRQQLLKCSVKVKRQTTWKVVLIRRPDPLTSLVLTVPVFLVYHLGILLIDFRNGVDLVSGITFRLLESSVVAYVAATLGVAGMLFLVGWIQRKRGRIRPAALAPVLLESGVWAVVMLFSVGWATAQLRAALSLAPASTGWSLGAGGMGPALALPAVALTLSPVLGPLDKLVMSAGAGFHEEVVFRVGLLSGLRHLLLRGSGVVGRAAVMLSLLGSSVLFALAHHLGPVADPIELTTLTFRTIAGVYLGGVYLMRGFAVVVYTHTLYDVLVFFVFS